LDVFAAGAILWELIAKAPMWGQLPTLTVMRRVRASDMPRLRDVVADIDPELERICRSAVAPQPDDRYPSARAMFDDLERYLSKRGGVPSDAALGALVRSACREQRLEAQRAIEARLAELGLARSAPPLRAGPSRDTLGDTACETLQAHTPGEEPPPAAPWVSFARRRTASTAAAASLFLALLAWGAFSWGTVLGARRAREESRAQLALTSSASVSSSEPGVLAGPAAHDHERALVAPSDAAPKPSLRDGPRLLPLRVDVRPSQAVLFLDGQRLSSNPMRAALVYDGLPHTIRAEASGFEPFSRTLPPGAELLLEATLRPSQAAAPARGTKPNPAPRSAKRGATLAAAPKKLAVDAARRARFSGVLDPRPLGGRD
jgi:serine/threonine-protein kinase